MAAVPACARRAVALVAVVSLLGGCAEILTRSTIEVTEQPDATPVVLGPPGGEITARGVEAQWTQDGDRLALRIDESRTCTSVRHVPVMRVERVDRRTAHGAMWFEYGLGAAALAGGLAGLIKPAAFSQASVTTADGRVLEDTRTGYRIGGILTGIGAVLLTAAVVDTVRTRDEVIQTEAYRRETGGAMECRDPLAPLQGHTVELLVGEWSSVEPTADDGGVRFLLPGAEDLPAEARAVIEATAAWEQAKAEAEAAKQAAEEAARAAAEAEAEAKAKKGKRRKGRASGTAKVSDERLGAAAPEAAAGAGAAGEPGEAALEQLGPRPEPVVVEGVLRIDSKRALAVDFVVPYDGEAAKGHNGRGSVEPGPAGPMIDKGKTKAAGGGKAQPLSLTGDGAGSATQDDAAAAER